MFYRFIFYCFIFIAPSLLLSQKNKFSRGTGLAWAIGANNNNLTTNDESTKYSLAEGNFYNFSYHYYPDSSHALLGITYQGAITRNVKTNINYNSSQKQFKTTAIDNFSHQMILQTGYWFKFKKINFELCIGVILPILNCTKQFIYIKDSFNITSIAKTKDKHYIALGFNSTFQVDYSIHENITLFTAFNLNLLKAKIKSSKVTSYKSTNGNSLESAFPTISDRETYYLKNVEDIRNNASSLSNNFNKNAANEMLSYSQSFSNYGFQLGLSLLF